MLITIITNYEKNVKSSTQKGIKTFRFVKNKDMRGGKNPFIGEKDLKNAYDIF